MFCSAWESWFNGFFSCKDIVRQASYLSLAMRCAPLRLLLDCFIGLRLICYLKSGDRAEEVCRWCLSAFPRCLSLPACSVAACEFANNGKTQHWKMHNVYPNTFSFILKLTHPIMQMASTFERYVWNKLLRTKVTRDNFIDILRYSMISDLY